MKAQAVIPVTTGYMPDGALDRSIGKRIPCSFLAAQVGHATLTKVTQDAAGRQVMHLTLDLPGFSLAESAAVPHSVALADGEDEL